MDQNRESVVIVKSPEFKEEEARCELRVRCDFGTEQCNARLQQARDLCVEIPNNCAIITHDFVTEEAAQQMAAKLMALKSGSGLPMLKNLETSKAVGKKLVLVLRAVESFCKDMAICHEFATYLGDFASIHEYAELLVATSRDLNTLLQDRSASMLTSALCCCCLRLRLSFRKELPIKIADFVASKSSPEQVPATRLIGRAIAAFHHLTYTIDLKQPTDEMKVTNKPEIQTMLMIAAEFAFNMLKTSGVLDIAQSGTSTTNLIFCVTPILSIEMTLHAPTAYDTLIKLLPFLCS